MSTIYPVDESYRKKSSTYAKLLSMTEEEFVSFFITSESTTDFEMGLMDITRVARNTVPYTYVLYIPSKDFYAYQYKNKCNQFFPDTAYCGKVKSDVTLWETPPDAVAKANKIALTWLSGRLNKLGPKGRMYSSKFYFSQRGIELAKRILTEMLKNKAQYSPILVKVTEDHINKYSARSATVAPVAANTASLDPVNPSPVAANVALDPVNPSPVVANVALDPVNPSPVPANAPPMVANAPPMVANAPPMVANVPPVSTNVALDPVTNTSVGGRRKTKRSKRKARRTKKRTRRS